VPATPPPGPKALLPTTTERTSHATHRRPYLLALLALAVVLLGVAALPRVGRHRLELAGLGVAVLAGAGISLLR
jgi:hypothetical protein